MAEALPWIISCAAVVAVLVMMCLHRAAPHANRPRPRRARTAAARTRREVKRQTRAKLERIAGAMESDNAENLIAEEMNREPRQ